MVFPCLLVWNIQAFLCGLPLCQSLSSVRMLAVFTEDPEASLLASCHSDECLTALNQMAG